MSQGLVPAVPEGRPSHPNYNLYAGLEFSTFEHLQNAIEDAREDCFDFVTIPLAVPLPSGLLKDTKDAVPAVVEDAYAYVPYAGSDMVLNGEQWSSLVVGKVSSWISLDSEDPVVRQVSEKAFAAELSWSAHVSMPAVLLPTPGRPLDDRSVQLRCSNYARNVLAHAKKHNYGQLWVEFPLAWNSDTAVGTPGPWHHWNVIRTLCDHTPGLYPALRLTEDVPSDAEVKQWMAEPIKVVILETKVFLTNKSGFPVLSKAHQRLIKEHLAPMAVQFIIRGVSKVEGNGRDYKPYWQYLKWLFTTIPALTQQEEFEYPFNDYLQSPLQPLMDNLHSGTYEVFEKDPIKYQQYEEAVYEALKDREKAHTVLMVVGAGRGPLVRASIRAAKKAEHTDIEFYAVEKNPNAVITLRAMKKDLGWTNVTIVDSDMRTWQAPEKADILVSELLGSFGDNELSPECLDGAQKFLKEDGISIPAAYTSYLAPLSTHKLWSQVNGTASTATDPMKHFETSYVVKVVNGQVLAKAQEVFVFEHPKFNQKIDNRRFKQLTFTSEEDQTLHGFVGYFDSKLYKDVYISILPETFSEGMFSWFPIYFPIRTPISVKKGEKIEISMWRVVSGGKVWYEWCVSSPQLTPIHNPSGRSHWIGL